MANPYGRRGLPPEEAVPAPPQQPSPPPRPSPRPGSPRRGIAPQDDGRDGDTRRAWFTVAILPLVIAAVVGVLWLVFGERGDGGTTAVPAPVTQNSEQRTPSATPSEEPSVAPNEAPQTPAEGEPSPTPAADTTTAAPAPAESPQLPTGPEEEPSPVSSTPGGVRLELNGTVLDMPPGWQLYADEVVQDERRLVRIRELATDVRIQAVSLTNVTGALDEACLELISDHRQLFTGVAEGLPVTVPLTGQGQGVSCNFTGTRASDGVPNRVEFTMLQLDDGTTLVFRDTIPSTVPEDSPALSQLVTMECAAAESFGISVNQCALTPGQADG
ncbi:hypothetical protein [Tessaracoccus sp. ZS01]|uniref:hypothetical protein n=1 Tax=Tessaracoccus sp. ZS01 TaxID=1906324 RepID=UPI00117C5334|nr:hypothetical protein [Tessaracoccus sp. ZS01]